LCIFGKNTVNLAFLWCFTHVFTQFCRLFFIFLCEIIVLELVVGNETIYKLKNGKEPDPRGKNKSLVFYKFWSNKKSKRNTKRTKSCVEVMYFTCVYLCVTCVHIRVSHCTSMVQDTTVPWEQKNKKVWKYRGQHSTVGTQFIQYNTVSQQVLYQKRSKIFFSQWISWFWTGVGGKNEKKWF